ncbi:MAG TPA: type II secretion system F family protein [Polyangiaceae bacterium]|nr:type II secretion system F family protein [Polyangiaceae bacterium]
MTEERIYLVATLAAAELLAGGVFLVGYGSARVAVLPGRAQLDDYVAYLDRMIRLCFVKAKPKTIVRGQALAVLLGLALYAGTSVTAVLLVPCLAVVGPALHLTALRRRRSQKFTAQTDGFLLALANSLKAVPNIPAALAGIMPVLQTPIREEIAIVLNELRVGSSVDQALLDASARAQSPAFDSAVTALLVGQKVGGDLPKILETSAATLREMNRLEGVVQSKTSESRAQLWVLACFPLGIVLLFNAVSPGFFDALAYTFTGQAVSVVAVVLWLSAIILARQLSKVDL